MSTRPDGTCVVVAELDTRSWGLLRKIDDGNVATLQNDSEGKPRTLRSDIPRKYLEEKIPSDREQ